ncbi:hypothetical protein [Glaciimonas soli]|uniref:Uncharacterized protein n=1 Tax=Glaciimonas soli TaxID=2590999 RepID=A0A843Z0G3_9BURK|nr:hypothetical protein [Glaciimonas soli]MQR02326.1 hypothetical protein [Glaciimonas soli]
MTIYSKASDIAIELSNRLASITIVNGYHTDIGKAVFRGRRKIDDHHIPCAILIEGDDTPTDTPGRLTDVAINQRYILGGYAACDPYHPNDRAHDILKDIKRAVFKEDAKLSGKVRRVTYRGRDIGPRMDGAAIVFTVIEIDVQFVENLTDP